MRHKEGNMGSIDDLLDKAKRFHGDVCPGLVLGTRMTAAGLRALGLDPAVRSRDLVVYAEIDRCMTDAVQAITGCSLGRRTLKHIDAGRFGATFLHLPTSRAVRVFSRNKPREAAITGDSRAGVELMLQTPEEELLGLQEVQVHASEWDMPGRPRHRTVCTKCGEGVLDHREVLVDGQPVCKVCATESYYSMVNS